MHRYCETRILPYSPTQLFALVVDIEKYPEFLPWCKAARVLSRTGDSFIAELLIRFSHLSESYSSRVTPCAPTATQEGTIAVELVSGPFSHLTNHWRFVPHADGCEIHLDLNFQFKSKLLDRMLGGLFSRACEKMVAAFTARAQTIYPR